MGNAPQKWNCDGYITNTELIFEGGNGMTKFVVFDYTKCEAGHLGNREVRIASLKELGEELDKAKADDEIRIAIYEIGDCLIDWS